MKTIIRNMVLLPLLVILATLASAPICDRARADGFLGLGWWVVPIAVGAVGVYALGRYQADDSYQRPAYQPPQPSYEPSQQGGGGYVAPNNADVQPVPVYSQEHWYDQPPSYTQQQYGYVLQ